MTTLVFIFAAAGLSLIAGSIVARAQQEHDTSETLKEWAMVCIALASIAVALAKGLGL